MSLLNKLANSVLGLKGSKPKQFGTDPIPPNSLHQSYSVDGDPNVVWRLVKGNLPNKPLPSTLDELDSNAPNLQPGGVVSTSYKSKPGRRYKDLGPSEGRF